VNSEGAKTRRTEPRREIPRAASTARSVPAPVSAKAEQAPAEPNKPLGFSLADKLDYTHPYLTERGLAEATVREFGLGFCQAGTLIGRIAIPLHNGQGELVGYVGRWPGEPPTPETPKYKLPKGFRKSAELFNLHRALKEPADAPLYLVEGVFDVLHLWQHGLRKVVALLGSSLSAEQETLLFDRTPFAPQLVLLLDADDAGRKGTAEMLARLAPRTFVKVVALPREDMQPEHLTAGEVISLPYLEDRP
jgi:DNA primase